MNEREIVEAYVNDRLPPNVEVVSVPIRRDGYGGIQVQLPRDPFAEPVPPDAPGYHEVTIKLNDWSEIKNGLWAGYSDETMQLVVGDWIDEQM